MQGYVNVVVMSNSLIKVLALLKLHGPEFLRGKYNFPGGHIEEGETPRQAARRELMEEAGIDVPEDALILFSHKVFGTEAELYTYCAVTNDVLAATQATDEPIRLFELPNAMIQALYDPSHFCPDFLSLIAGAVEAYRARPAAPKL